MNSDWVTKTLLALIAAALLMQSFRRAPVAQAQGAVVQRVLVENQVLTVRPDGAFNVRVVNNPSDGIPIQPVSSPQAEIGPQPLPVVIKPEILQKAMPVTVKPDVLQRWQYMRSSCELGALEDLGNRGWEVVGVVSLPAPELCGAILKHGS